MIKKFTLLLSIITSITSLAPHSSMQAGPIKKVVVFDIGGVLATYSESEVGMSVFKNVVKECGFFKTVKYAISQGSNLKNRLRTLVNQVLEEVGKEYTDFPVIYSDKGHPHPRGLCLLHGGIIFSKEFTCTARAILCQWWNQDKNVGKKNRRLYSQTEMAFVRHTITMMGNGNTLATIFKPCKEGIEILRQAVARPDVEVMILSNYPIDQFDALLNQPFMKAALEGIPADQIFCSGQLMPAHSHNGLPERLLAPKPHPTAFAEVTLFCHDKWGVQPQDIIFVDNQPENVLSARSVGIDGLLVNSINEQTEVYACSFKELSKLINMRLQLPHALIDGNLLHHLQNCSQ